MKQIFSNVIQFRGSHYDLGFIQGKQLIDSPILKNREKHWKVRQPRFSVDESETKEMLNQFAPGIWEELLGLQEALQLPMQTMLRDFCGYRIPVDKSGCSIVTGKNFMVRNYDFHPKTYEGRFNLYQPTDTGYATIGPAQRITGRMDGMNEKGLAMGYNAINRKAPGPGFVCWMIGRMILENCRSAEEAVQLLKEIPHRHTFSYVLLDCTEKTMIVETSPRGLEVREGNACTNHHEILTEENRNYLADSKRRLDIILEEKKESTDWEKAFRLMNDTDKNVFSKEYKSWAGTIHTTAYLPKEKQIFIALGGDQKPILFDFAKWLQGEELEIKKIYGEVDTEINFAHME